MGWRNLSKTAEKSEKSSSSPCAAGVFVKKCDSDVHSQFADDFLEKTFHMFVYLYPYLSDK
jgi:hypothetical protein